MEWWLPDAGELSASIPSDGSWRCKALDLLLELMKLFMAMAKELGLAEYADFV